MKSRSVFVGLKHIYTLKHISTEHLSKEMNPINTELDIISLEGGEALEQAAQGSCGWNPSQPGLAGSALAHGRVLKVDDL